MKVAVTGITGMLGANLAEALVRAGHTVVGVRRSSSRIDHLTDLAIEWRQAELDTASLTAAFADVTAVFHCAAHVSVQRHVTESLRRTNVDGTRAVIEACRAARVTRLIHTSSVAAVGVADQPTHMIDESAPFNLAAHALLDGYAATKRESEELVLAATQAGTDGLDACVVNPGYLIGPRDIGPSSGKIILDIARRRLPATTSGVASFADPRDVAETMVAAWQRGRRGERYIVAGHMATWHDVIHAVAREIGVAPPRWAAPKWLGRAMGVWHDALEVVGVRPAVNSTQLRYAFHHGLRYSSAKAERELGYRARPLADSIRDAVVWFRARNML